MIPDDQSRSHKSLLRGRRRFVVFFRGEFRESQGDGNKVDFLPPETEKERKSITSWGEKGELEADLSLVIGVKAVDDAFDALGDAHVELVLINVLKATFVQLTLRMVFVYWSRDGTKLMQDTDRPMSLRVRWALGSFRKDCDASSALSRGEEFNFLEFYC